VKATHIIKTISLDPETNKIVENERKKSRRSYSSQVAVIINDWKTAKDILFEKEVGNEEKEGKENQKQKKK
jgi:hypothetical protein